MLTTKIFSTTSALLIALSFPIAHAASRETKETLQDMEMQATDAADRADQLSLSTGLSRWSHSIALMAIKDDVNRMGRELANLEAERASLPQWEQQASDKALPLLKEAATSAQSAIEYLNENPTSLWTEDYRNYTTTVWRDADQLAKTLKDYLKYAKAQGQEQHLEQNLGMTGN